MRLKFFLLAILCGTVPVFASVYSVGGSLSPSQIRIGEHVSLHYEITQQAEDIVSAPVFGDTIIKGVEIIETAKYDTVDLKDGRIQVSVDYLVTSFDSGFYYIPPMIFACNGDSVESRALGLSVNTVEVNPDTDDVKDIKDIMDAPFSWAEFFKWFGIVAGILAVVAVIAFILVKYVFKKQIPFIETPTKPELPPHVAALQQLERIKEEKIWQSGRVKDFYTAITDVLREYMDRRFGINAMELTSDEILALAKKNPEMEEVRQLLRQMLELSDLVKFAKFVPVEAENSRSMIDAFTFVEKTTPEPQVSENDDDLQREVIDIRGKEEKQ